MTQPPPPISPEAASRKPVTSEDAGAEVEQGRPRVFPCDSCGADFEFSIDAQSLKCPFCGHVKQLEFEAGAGVEEQDLRDAIDAVAERRARGEGTMPGVQEVACRDCGAKVQFHGTLTSQECPYCASPIALEAVAKVSSTASGPGLDLYVGARPP